MSEMYRFFNSTPGDERTYQAEEFAEYFRQFLSSGLYHENEEPNLKVDSEGTDMQVYVEPGTAFIQGYMYKNTDDLYLEHDSAEPTEDRIDRIVIRLDRTQENRFVKAFVLKGTPAAEPEPPEITRDDWIYEISLAQVYIEADTATIDPDNIEDERFDEDVCGLVSSLITVPTSDFETEWQDWWNSDDGPKGMEEDWQEWFDGIEEGTYVTYEDFNSHKLDYVHHGELIAFPGHYVVTEFDTPTEGDIQQKMYKSADDTLVVTYTTEFDKPTKGDITETVETADGEIYNEKITEFDEPTEGDIKETVSEVSA